MAKIVRTQYPAVLTPVEQTLISTPVSATPPLGFSRLQVDDLQAQRTDAYVSFDGQRYLFVTDALGRSIVDVPKDAVPGFLKAGGFTLIS
jgi:hypothetical protein